MTCHSRIVWRVSQPWGAPNQPGAGQPIGPNTGWAGGPQSGFGQQGAWGPPQGYLAPQGPSYPPPGQPPTGYQPPPGQFTQPGFQQPGFPQPGLPQGQGGYPGPSGQPWPGFPPPPPPRRRVSNGLMVVFIVLLGVALLALVASLVNPNRNSADDGVEYQNESYTAPPPDVNPPALPEPQTEQEAWDLVKKNRLYEQTAPRPIRCELSTIDPTQASKDELDAHFEQLTACLMKQWAGVLEAAGYTMVRPTVTVFEGSVLTACGKAESHNAFYCGGDQQVYIAMDVLVVLPPAVRKSRIAVDVILAHEFGHAIQARTGILASDHGLEAQGTKSQALELSRRAETQADCLAGVYIGGVAQSMKLTPEDFANVRATYHAVGDDVLTGKPDIVGDHGLAVNREYWGQLGIETTPAQVGVCNTWVAPDEKVR